MADRRQGCAALPARVATRAALDETIEMDEQRRPTGAKRSCLSLLSDASDRFRAAVEAGEIAGSSELFGEGAVFRSQVVYRTYTGRDAALKVLEAAERLLGLGGHFHFHYVQHPEDSDARVAILEFATEVDGVGRSRASTSSPSTRTDASQS